MSYKRAILVAIFLFCAGLVLGFFAPSGLAFWLAGEVATLGELAITVPPFQVSTCIFLFLKNTFTIFFSFFLSPILCLVPIFALVFNGLILAFLSAAMIQQESLGLTLAALLPHGIFELPAFILGEAVALSLGTKAMIVLLRREGRHKLGPAFKQGLKRLPAPILLLMPAAIVETYVTPLLLARYW